MLTKSQQADIINRLDQEFDVQDVYFHKGVLYVINTYDVPVVEDFLDVVGDYIAYQVVSEDMYA